MAKATLQLKSGAKVTVEGSVLEVKELLDLYSDSQSTHTSSESASAPRRVHTRESRTDATKSAAPDITEIVNAIKNSEEFDAIEKFILDQPNRVHRVLLPLYIVHSHLQNRYGLTSGDIKRITIDLGIPISQSNIAKVLAGSASRYVIGDKVRLKGSPVRYRIARRGEQQVKLVLNPKKG